MQLQFSIFLNYLLCSYRARKCPNYFVLQLQFFQESIMHKYAGAIGKLPGWENLTQKQSRCPTTWKDMLEKCVDRCCELANKKSGAVIQSFKSSLELSTVCSQIVLKCSYLTRIGRPDILWSVKKKACKSSHKLDSGLRQTFGKIDFTHSSHK